MNARLFASWLGLAACLPIPTAASEREEPTGKLEPPGYEWAYKPSGNDMADVLPDKAKQKGLSGHVLLVCRVVEGGRVSDCRVAVETPEGIGYGKAAITLSKRFRMKPVGEGPAQWGGPVRIPIRFFMPYDIMPIDRARPGEPSMIVTVVEAGAKEKVAVFDCPSAKAPERKCQGHEVDWAESPSVDDIATMIRKAGGGVTVMECLVGQDGGLSKCNVSSDGAALTQDDFLALAKRFKAPAATVDKVSTAGRRAVVGFDWKILAQVLDTFESFKPAPLPVSRTEPRAK